MFLTIDNGFGQSNISYTQVLDLTNKTTIGWENDGPCHKEVSFGNRNIADEINALRYNSSYQGLQRVSWDSGRNLYHVLKITNDSILYYTTSFLSVKYMYNPNEGFYVDMGSGFHQARQT